MGTNANGYEIRLGILDMAKSLLSEEWHLKVDAARFNAERTSTTFVPPDAPTFGEIENLAKKLYGFVQDRGD